MVTGFLIYKGDGFGPVVSIVFSRYSSAIPALTGDKGQFTRPVHCKYITRKWTKYLGYTHLVHSQVHSEFSLPVFLQFPWPGE